MTINTRMEITFRLLDALGSSHLAMPEGNRTETMERQLKRFAQTFEFYLINITLKDGSVLCSGDHPQHTEELAPTIAEVLTVHSQVVTRIRNDESSAYEGIIYAQPLYQSGEVIGAITAWSAVDALRDVVSIDTLKGQGFSLIIDDNMVQQSVLIVIVVVAMFILLIIYTLRQQHNQPEKDQAAGLPGSGHRRYQPAALRCGG